MAGGGDVSWGTGKIRRPSLVRPISPMQDRWVYSAAATRLAFLSLARRILLDTGRSTWIWSEFISSAATFVPSCRFGSLKSSQRFSTAGLCNRERHSTGRIYGESR